MNHPLTPETSAAPLAPGQRLPLSERKQLSPEAVAEIQAIAGSYPDPLAATLPALYIAQREFGFLSLAAMKQVAAALAVPEGHVFGVATFYTLFRKQPAGRYHFQVCTNLCCALNGANELLRKVAARTGAVPGEGPTADGMWSLEEVECLASCGSAPCLQVNEGVYDEFVDEAKLEAILDACRRGDYSPWGE
jgi:NADH:ubiquinone oxidoreductase subunit E